MLELVHQQVVVLPQAHLLAVVLQVLAVAVVLQVLAVAVVLQVLAVVVHQVPAEADTADTKKPYRQKNTPNFFRGILVIKS